MNNRKIKREEQIKEIIARFIERESNKTAMITISRVELDDRGRNGIIFITVLPESGESSALNFLKRKRSEIRNAIKKQLSIHPIPFFDVSIDSGEKSRQTIEALLKE